MRAERHPGDHVLALLAGGELNFWERWQINLHVKRCRSCYREVEAFRKAQLSLREAVQEMPGELPVPWDTLAREMTANIHLGLAAGECVGGVKPRPVRFGWRGALVAASLSALMLSAWVLNIPQPQSQHLVQSLRRIVGGKPPVVEQGMRLETSAAGLELLENGRGMTMLHPDSDSVPVTISVNTQGSLRARYVDAETDQVTINNVYAQ